MNCLQIAERIIPLYFVVLLGYIGSKKIGIQKENLAPLAVYLLTPLVVFSAVARAKFDLSFALLPPFFFFISVLFSISGYLIASIWFDSPAKNILAYSAGQGNSGYFAIPIGMSIFGTESLSAIVLCSLGFILCETTVGFYLVARGHYSVRQSLYRVFKLPAIYGFFLGLIINQLHISWGDNVQDMFSNIRGAYSVIGMMIIGLAVADLPAWKVDLGFTGFALIMKHICWPVLIFALLKCDEGTLNLCTPLTRRLIFFMSTVPLAANSVAFSTLLHAEPGKTAVAVLISTLAALVIVPLLNGLAASWFM